MKMMRRPGDQAKLLFLYLLRSSAALASGSAKDSVAVLKSVHQQQQQHQQTLVDAMGGYICLRVARRTDVPSIQRCNLATLPENYNSNFYTNHMRQWPELALVAEHVPEGCEDAQQRQLLSGRKLLGNAKVTPNSNTSFATGYNPNGRTSQIIGYVLGKVEEIPVRRAPLSNRNKLRLPSKVIEDSDLLSSVNSNLKNTERLGHVTSIAILDGYRRRGIAGELMDQLHHEMKHRYKADAIDLHVRCSNEAARVLYRCNMGYKVEDVIPKYYLDPAEDAFLMRKDMNEEVKNLILDDVSDGSQEPISTDAENSGIAAASANVFMRNFRFPKIRTTQTRLNSSNVNGASSKLELPRVILNLDKVKDEEEGMDDLESLPTAVSATSSL